jgi:hypothetical protein
MLIFVFRCLKSSARMRSRHSREVLYSNYGHREIVHMLTANNPSSPYTQDLLATMLNSILIPCITGLRRAAECWPELLCVDVLSGFWGWDSAAPVEDCGDWEIFARKLPNDIICAVIAMKRKKGFLIGSSPTPPQSHVTNQKHRHSGTTNLPEPSSFRSHLPQFCGPLNIWYFKETIPGNFCSNFACNQFVALPATCFMTSVFQVVNIAFAHFRRHIKFVLKFFPLFNLAFVIRRFTAVSKRRQVRLV